jgi:CRP-like cAMP-binding protein
MDISQEVAQLLRSSSLFQDLDLTEVAEFAGLMQPAVFAAGEILFRQGAPADRAFLLTTGSVEISTRMPGDERVLLAEMEPGELVGETALIRRTTRSASATAVTPVRAFMLDGEAFDRLRGQCCPAASKVLRRLALLLCGRLRRVSQDLVSALGACSVQTARSVTPPPEGQPTGPTEACRAALPILPFFREFTAAEIEAFAACTVQWSLPRGHVLFIEGDPAASCFVTVRGAVQISVQRGERGSRLVLLGPGRLFGELALLDGGPRSATVQVREDAVLLEVGRDAFDRLSGDGTCTAVKVLEAINRNLLAAQQRAVAQQAALAADAALRGG